MREKLVEEFDSDEVCTRLCRTVEILRVAEYALVEVLLESIENVLDATVELHFQMVVEYERVVQFQVDFHEIRCTFHPVFLNVACKVRNEHLAGIDSRD